jgi:valyl-tRNA synthetase
MEKRYHPGEVEEKWQNFWEEKKYFLPHSTSRRSSFSMVMPPPNITGSLHMGHALNLTLQDILTRSKRMQGYEVIWVPGIDHAGIATQHVVEKSLARQGLSREKLGREEFIKRVWQWKEKYGGEIFAQLKSLGVSCSWEDSVFTMDPGHSRAVEEVFIRLYQEGYIYQGDYIINWCPGCQTALSDIEVEHEEREGKLYYIRYPFKNKTKGECLVVATTRPETMLGDTAVAVNPQDERFKDLEGRKLLLPLLGRELPLVYDRYVDPEFGSGALKVTPAHDANDFLIGKEHELRFINIFNQDASINENGGKYQGLTRYEARRKVVEDLEKGGYLERIEDYRLRIGRCYRCRAEIEPYLSTQWFIKMKNLAAEAMKAARKKKIEFIPSFWKKNYLRWLENIRDWCISRQIWWGHRLPIWYCRDCGEIMVTSGIPTYCFHCKSQDIKQDEGVLDTWFSSSLWPFSTLGWPEQGERFEKFYPTSVLCTGWDILFFWVSRMVMMALKFTQQVPFHKVYIHPLIGDERGEKMSKSRGNVVDPLDMMKSYGTDAFRFSLVALKTGAPYVRFSEDRVRGYRNFVNKIWNASRFVLMNLEDFKPEDKLQEDNLELCHRWILSRYGSLVRKITLDMEKFRFSEGANSLYQFVWGEFCDWYIELVKPYLAPREDVKSRYRAQWVLHCVIEGTLKLLHPFMPFVTEEIYQRLSGGRDSIMISSWPKGRARRDTEAEEKMSLLMKIIQEARMIRSEMRIPPQKKIELLIRPLYGKKLTILREHKSYIINLVGVSSLLIDRDLSRPAGSASSLVDGVEIFIPLRGILEIEKERKRLVSVVDQLNKKLALLGEKISRPEFKTKAPPGVVEKKKKEEKELRMKLQRLEKRIQEVS